MGVAVITKICGGDTFFFHSLLLYELLCFLCGIPQRFILGVLHPQLFESCPGDSLSVHADLSLRVWMGMKVVGAEVGIWVCKPLQQHGVRPIGAFLPWPVPEPQPPVASLRGLFEWLRSPVGPYGLKWRL